MNETLVIIQDVPETYKACMSKISQGTKGSRGIPRPVAPQFLEAEGPPSREGRAD